MTTPEITAPTPDRITLPSTITLEELLETLMRGNIPVETFGTGKAKTIHHLLSEVTEGEAIITVDEKGTVFREISVLWVDVLCELADGSVYYLREDRQEFKDGRTKRRGLDSSVGEKLKPDESSQDAVQRALSEELGVETYDRLYKVGYNERTFMPDSFPGIESTYKMHQYVTIIPEASFQPEGYIEYQEDKTNYYTWDRIR